MKYAYYNSKFNFNVIQGIKHYIKKKPTTLQLTGYSPIISPGTIEGKNKIHRITYKFEKKYKWSKIQEKYLLKIIKLAQSQNTKIIFYESPHYVKSNFNFIKRAEMQKKTKKIAANFGIDYLIFDTMKLSLDKNNFLYATAMYEEPSIQFTKVLSTYIKK